MALHAPGGTWLLGAARCIHSVGGEVDDFMVPEDSYEPSEALPVRSVSKIAHPAAMQARVAKNGCFQGANRRGGGLVGI